MAEMRGVLSILLEQVSCNVRQARQRLGLSQQELAKRTGLSRRMITLIESAVGNASLGTLDRIAQALDVPFADLVRSPLTSTALPAKPVQAWQGRRAGSRASLLQSMPAHHNVELWEWRLAPAERYQAEADPRGMHEFIFVIAGTLTLELTDKKQIVRSGQSIAFPSDQPYAYVNAGRTALRFVKNVVF